MPKGLGHPATGAEHPIQGDLLGLGADGISGKDRIGQPSTTYIQVGGIWVPAGSVPLLVSESWTALIAEKLAALLEAQEDTTSSIAEVIARASQRQEIGVPSRALVRDQMPVDQAQPANEGVGHVSGFANYQGIPYYHDLGVLAALGFRKMVAVDGGAYTSPAAGADQVSYTGLDLVGLIAPVVYNLSDKTWHDVSNVANPAGANPGTFDLYPPVRTATPDLVILYLSVPHSYSTLADATRTDRVNPEWAHMVEPNRVLDFTGQEANNVYQTIWNNVDYSFHGIQIEWSRVAGARTYQWDIFGKLDDGAWPAPAAGVSTIPACFNINTLFQVTAGSTGFAVAAGAGCIVARTQDRIPFSSICLERTVAGGPDANNSSYECWIDLYGGCR